MQQITLNKNKLIEKWENIHLLDDIQENDKIFYVQNFEEALNVLKNNNTIKENEYIGELEQMTFPLIYKLTKKRKHFNVENVILNFSEKFVADHKTLKTFEDEINYLENFVKEYVFTE